VTLALNLILHLALYTLHPNPNPTPYTVHPTPYTLHPILILTLILIRNLKRGNNTAVQRQATSSCSYYTTVTRSSAC
jgi:hypothetical protein